MLSSGNFQKLDTFIYF